MTLYERYTTGEDHAAGIYGRYWKGQTFTIGNTGANENHNITSVKLKLFRQGSPGMLTVHIRATSGGKPTGSDLTSGTTDGNTLTTAYAGEWREIALTPYELSANTQYAQIVQTSLATALIEWLLKKTKQVQLIRGALLFILLILRHLGNRKQGFDV